VNEEADVLDVRLAAPRGASATVAVVVPADDLPTAVALVDESQRADAAAFLDDVEATGSAGSTQTLARPGRRTKRILFVGIGDGDPADWRAAGAALVKAAKKDTTLTVTLPNWVSTTSIGALAEGFWLAEYRYWLGADLGDKAPKLRRINLRLVDPPSVVDPDAPEHDGDTPAPPVRGAATVGRGSVADADGGAIPTDPEALATAIDRARAVAEATILARDLTNTPSDRKSPAWMARQIEKAATGVPNLTVKIRDPRALADEGFNGVLAVGQGSTRGPRFVELSWRPRGATRHVVLVGKGITFDTGGICIKPRAGMKLMRKDMGGAAAVLAATLGAAALRLPVRVTALAPLAENAVGEDAYRPGDVVHHYGGITSEITNTDAEGRLVLADALAYAARRLRPDLVVDLATLTGAQSVALGKRTAALYSENDSLAAELLTAAASAGESVWRMPLNDDYVEHLASDIADLVNSTDVGAGSMLAALFLREFTGTTRDRWAHIDMSAPAWADSADAELAKGAPGWGGRTLLRWLETTA
jgi:leucyl aminopeptidase